MTGHTHTITAARLTALLLFALGLLTGCAKHYQEQADKATYNIIAHKRKAALNETAPFTIEQKPQDPLAGLPLKHQPLIADPAAVEAGFIPKEPEPTALLSLNGALEIAVRNSRDYQAEKEDVYLTALDLTAERHAFQPTLTGLLAGAWTREKPEKTWSADTQLGVSQLLATGGTISLRITNTFLRYATHAPRPEATTALAIELAQPLWRGAGWHIAKENLTQSERDVVYSIRSFTRFHKTFAVSVVTRYYRVLQQRALIRNEWNNYQRLRQGRERSEMLARAGRLPEFEVDQAQQDELSARNRFIRSLQTYQDRLDDLKRFLALPTDARIDIDEAELTRLMNLGIIHPTVSFQDAMDYALKHRLDLLSADDAVTDAKRKVEVAANGLGPDVDLVASADIATPYATKPTRLRFDQGVYSAGLNVDLPLDRVSERNTYRQTLITLNRQQRAADDLRDAIKLQIRDAWRTVEQARESYTIQRRSLTLAERRVDSTSLLIQAGRATTRDTLEAQRALLEAQNALTSAVVDHTIARLNLWRDIGTLTIAPDGKLKGTLP